MQPWSNIHAFVCVPLIAAACLSSATAGADDDATKPPPCSTAAHHQFDFWTGTWEVKENGDVAGRNRIERILGGCALLESWEGASESRGHSLNFYDVADGRWHQTWVDNAGGSLDLEGGLENGSMVLSGRRAPRAQADAVKETLHRITWTPLPGGQVRQHWEASNDDGASWRTLFDGLYTRTDD